MSITKQHLETLQPSSTLLINETSKEMERNGKTIYKFGFGQSPFPVPDKLVEKLKENAHQKDYLPAKGLLNLRQAISKSLIKKKYKNFTENNIVIGPGSKELMFLLQICFDGDLILPAPSWVSYEPQSIIAKNNVHWIQTSADSNWHVTAKQIEEVAKKIKSQNKLIILNSPNNPSGTNAKNLKELAEVFEKHNFTVLSDEIYTDLYRISEAEDWMNKAKKIIFIGTSFSVNITSIALRIAISRGIKIDIVDPNPIKINYDKVNYHQMNAKEYSNFRNLN